MENDLDLVGVAEIQQMYDVSKSTAHSWTRQRGFPAPVITLKMGPIWRGEDVQRWHVGKAPLQ